MILTISLVFCLKAAAKETQTATTLVIADESNGSIFGIQAPPETGRSSEFIKKAAFKSIVEIGHIQVPLKSDQEPAVVEILRYIKDKKVMTP